LPNRGDFRLKGKPVQVRRGPATVIRGRASRFHCSDMEWEGEARRTNPRARKPACFGQANEILSRKRIGCSGKCNVFRNPLMATPVSAWRKRGFFVAGPDSPSQASSSNHRKKDGENDERAVDGTDEETRMESGRVALDGGDIGRMRSGRLRK